MYIHTSSYILIYCNLLQTSSLLLEHIGVIFSFSMIFPLRLLDLKKPLDTFTHVLHATSMVWTK